MQLLGMLDWQNFPDRPDQRFSPLEPPAVRSVHRRISCKIDQHISYVADLGNIWLRTLRWFGSWVSTLSLAGFYWGFDVIASFPPIATLTLDRSSTKEAIKLDNGWLAKNQSQKEGLHE
jgi:hypothetical protein